MTIRADTALLWKARSTNGRWGLAIVGPEGTKLPCQGAMAAAFARLQ